jgi:hypothetical protein
MTITLVLSSVAFSGCATLSDPAFLQGVSGALQQSGQNMSALNQCKAGAVAANSRAAVNACYSQFNQAQQMLQTY